MKDDLSSIFHKPEFKQLLAKYSDMVNNQTPIYLEPDEITLLAEYYAGIENIKASEAVVNYGLSLHPDNLDIQIFKCHNLVICGQTDEAQLLLNSLPDANDYEVRLLQAEIYLVQKRDQEADEFLNQLYQDEQDIDVMLDIAHLYMNDQQKQKACYWLQKAQDENPDHLGLLEEMASYEFTFGDPQKAVKLYNRLLDEAPYTLDFWQNLIRCYIRMNEPEKALEALEFAMAIDETDLINWELKSNCYLQQNRAKQAIDCLLYVEQHTTEKAYIQNILLSAYFYIQDFERILEYSNKLLASQKLSNFEMAPLYYKRATAYLQLKNREACKNDIRQGLAYDNHYSELYILKGEVCLEEGKLDEAKEAFHYGELYAEDLTEAFSLIGLSYFKNEYMKEAIPYFIKQEEIAPETMGINYFLVAYSYLYLQENQQAIPYLVRGIIYAPETIESDENLAIPNGASGDFLKLVRMVTEKIRSGEINPAPFLKNK